MKIDLRIELKNMIKEKVIMVIGEKYAAKIEALRNEIETDVEKEADKQAKWVLTQIKFLNKKK